VGKSNEYNYVIFALEDGTGVIADYAGPFLAAHCKGSNQKSVGCLFYLGATSVNSQGHPLGFQPMPDPMLNAYRFLRDRILRPFGVCTTSTVETFHKDMPHAATPCPGASVIGRRAELLLPNPG
jgi:hypothetical protein